MADTEFEAIKPEDVEPEHAVEAIRPEDVEPEHQSAAKADGPSRGAAAVAGVRQLGTFGFSDELGAGMQSALSGFEPGVYTKARDENRAEDKAARDAHPGYYYGAGAPAAVATSLALPGVKAAQGAGALAKLGATAVNGVAQGALAGAGDSEANTPGGVAKDSAWGGVAGGLGGAVLHGVGSSAKWAGGKLLNGLIEAGATAKDLARMGVDISKLTLGQMNPEGAMAQLEESGQHAIASGNVIRGQREAGNQAWRDAALSRGMAPYSPLPAGSTAERLTAAKASFNAPYGAVGDNPVKTAGPGEQSLRDQLRKSFADVVADPGPRATDADRSALLKSLNNEVTALPYEPGKPNSVQDLIGLRHNIRTDLAGEDNTQVAKLLRNSEGAVTDNIEKNLPEHARQSLRDTDKQYSLYKTLEKANANAGDNPAGLMPQHLSSAVKSATEEGAYARGGGGDLRELAQLGRESLQTKTPPTGVRALMSLFPGSHHIQAPVAAIANTDSVKRALLGQTGAQEKTRALLEAMKSNPALGKALERGGLRGLIEAYSAAEHP